MSNNPYQAPNTTNPDIQDATDNNPKSHFDNLFTRRGRINRAKYWMYNIMVILAIVLFIVLYEAFEIGFSDLILLKQEFIIILIILPFIWINIALSVKRLHDHDKSGWFFLIYLIPYIGGLWQFIECGCLKGTSGPNRFGQDPLRK